MEPLGAGLLVFSAACLFALASAEDDVSVPVAQPYAYDFCGYTGETLVAGTRAWASAFERATGKHLRTVHLEKPAWEPQVYVPSADGRHLAGLTPAWRTPNSDRVALWDLQDGRLKRDWTTVVQKDFRWLSIKLPGRNSFEASFDEFPTDVRAAAWSADGGTLYAVTGGTYFRFEVASGKTSAFRYRTESMRRVGPVALDQPLPSGKLAIAYALQRDIDSRLMIIDPESAEARSAEIKGIAIAIHELTSYYVVTAVSNRTVGPFGQSPIGGSGPPEIRWHDFRYIFLDRKDLKAVNTFRLNGWFHQSFAAGDAVVALAYTSYGSDGCAFRLRRFTATGEDLPARRTGSMGLTPIARSIRYNWLNAQHRFDGTRLLLLDGNYRCREISLAPPDHSPFVVPEN